mgnify:CR=1 FL=1
MLATARLKIVGPHAFIRTAVRANRPRRSPGTIIIDRRTSKLVMRRLNAILAVDVVGYSRLMSENEAKTLRDITRMKSDVFDPTVKRHGGRIAKLMGDGALVVLPSACAAVEAALDVQRALAEMPDCPRVRIGINLGDVIEDGTDIYGDGVNLAARLEAIAPPGGVCISALVRECLQPE